MRIQHLVLENLFRVFGNINYHKPKFRILNVHDILEKDFDSLEKILINLKKDWIFIDPLKINELNKTKKNCILLTFDDGYKSQKIFADKILNKHKINAIFFVVTAFMECNSKEEAKNFVLKNIDKSIDKNIERFSEINNMNFDDLNELHSLKHVIGSHTVNHKMLTEIKENEYLNFEINNSKNTLETMLNSKIDNFAWTYGDINSINKKVFKIIEKNYKNIFSGIRGDNFKVKSKSIFFRDELSPFYSLELVNAFLNGYSDPYYYKNRKKLLDFEADV